MSKGTSGSCTRFIQNTWKKELCSNCYRPKEEHQLLLPKNNKNKHVRHTSPPVLSSSSSSSSSSCCLQAPAQGILIINNKNDFKKKTVRFTKEEIEIIGYGGDGEEESDLDYGDDDDNIHTSSCDWNCGDPEEYGDGEEDKALDKLTKSNTDFNSILSNLNGENNKVHQQLSLGIKNHKEKLKVSIQPFVSSPSIQCASNNSSSIAASRKSHLNKLLEDEHSTKHTITSSSSSLLVFGGGSTTENLDSLKTTSATTISPVKKVTKELQQQQVPPIKTILIESLTNNVNYNNNNNNNSGKKEERGNPEGRKVQIQRGNVITKSHEQVKNKFYIQNIVQKEKRSSQPLQLDKANENLKTLIIRTNCANLDGEKSKINKPESPLLKKNHENNESFTTATLQDATLQIQPKKLNIENEVTVKVLKLLNGEDGPAESREMAGEPDGKADSDEPETPQLLSPPPRTSFLHRDAVATATTATSNPLKTTTNSNSSSPVTSQPPHLLLELSPPLETKLLSSSSTAAQVTTVSSCDHIANNSSTTTSSSSSSSSLGGDCSPLAILPPPPPPDLATPPGLLLARCKRPAPKPPTPELQLQPQTVAVATTPIPLTPPEPVPRQRRGSNEVLPLSVTQALMGTASGTGTISEKKKTRVRQTLRKLLRLGREDQETANAGGGVNKDDEHLVAHQHHPHQSRPRPHIIHPLDLNKSGVQVLPPQSTTAGDKSSSSESVSHLARPSKPPPPPRSESLNLMERLRPTPNSENNVYANLGENRCGMTPIKPQRTNSLRDHHTNSPQLSAVAVTAAAGPPPPPPPPNTKQFYELSSSSNDHVYECVGVMNSAPECDMDMGRQRASLLYSSTGSETESDIYYPYVTFQNGECKTTLKRRERGAVHCSLEENYGAVIVANYQSLSYILSQANVKSSNFCPYELENFIKNPSWSQFKFNNRNALKFGNLTLLNGSLDDNHDGCDMVAMAVVSLVVGDDDNYDDDDHHTVLHSLPNDLQPLATFTDQIHSDVFCTNAQESSSLTTTTHNIHLLGRLKLLRLSDYATNLQRSAEGVREAILILLQAVDYMLIDNSKHYNVDNFIIYMRHNESSARVTYITTTTTTTTSSSSSSSTMNNEEETNFVKYNIETLRSLCNCLLLTDLFLCRVINNYLSKVNLKEVRILLETWLWGPALQLALPALRRWLDLERATFLHTIVCNNKNNNNKSKTIIDDDKTKLLHLKFLVETEVQDIAAATTYFNEASANNRYLTKNTLNSLLYQNEDIIQDDMV